MPLTPEDEVFVERSFQRTLIELEKLIGFSGTPTVVWRRTGEIMLVGTEFTLLSEWRRDELLFRDAEGAAQNVDPSARKPATSRKPKRSYIFEIFDQKSCVEYYESFAAHAFESSSSVSIGLCLFGLIGELSLRNVYRQSCRPAAWSHRKGGRCPVRSPIHSSGTCLVCRVMSSGSSCQFFSDSTVYTCYR